MTVRLADDNLEKDLSIAQKTALAAAALSVVEEEQSDVAEQGGGGPE